MKSDRINLWKKGEYSYSHALGFEPNMVSYLHEDDEKHPCIVVVPGGGYCMVAPPEGELVALKFFEFGYNAFVITYTTNLLMDTPLNFQPMKDVSRAIRKIRKDADKYGILPDRLMICGYSAGGHLCGSVCVHYEDIEETDESLKDISNRPDAALLSYPVITSGEFAHRDSFIALLGRDADEKQLEYFSLEKQVTKDTPPTFLWHTIPDGLVPVENSFLYEAALRKAGVRHALHLFSHGDHGLSLGNEDWAKGRFGGMYTMEQTENIIKALREDTIETTPEKKKEMLDMFGGGGFPEGKPVHEIRLWPELANDWFKELFE
ncbi:alpha/beta hydrolase [Butyrivibrio sp. WCD3002]|uniref:alpha/beta hydrolase n=1 Tax=Butyrivibrio sp. WCD3002 TaxID=1280676 RepID=UPI00047EC6FC|nr:alpha/beta hydrolase [Butyrivibrio sp. WCD3002]